MIRDNFVDDRGFDKYTVDRTKICQDLLERLDGMYSPEELEDVIDKVLFNLEESYWNIINDKTNL